MHLKNKTFLVKKAKQENKTEDNDLLNIGLRAAGSGLALGTAQRFVDAGKNTKKIRNNISAIEDSIRNRQITNNHDITRGNSSYQHMDSALSKILNNDFNGVFNEFDKQKKGKSINNMIDFYNSLPSEYNNLKKKLSSKDQNKLEDFRKALFGSSDPYKKPNAISAEDFIAAKKEFFANKADNKINNKQLDKEQIRLAAISNPDIAIEDIKNYNNIKKNQLNDKLWANRPKIGSKHIVAGGLGAALSVLSDLG